MSHLSGGSDGLTFGNVGWTGWIGAITGVSSGPLAISEIGVSFPDASFGKESRVGNPFTFLLRDILQFDRSLLQAEHRINTTKRTCDLILAVGDGSKGLAPEESFRGVQYSASVANFYDDKNQLPVNSSWHPRIADVAYNGKPSSCRD